MWMMQPASLRGCEAVVAKYEATGYISAEVIVIYCGQNVTCSYVVTFDANANERWDLFLEGMKIDVSRIFKQTMPSRRGCCQISD